MIGRTKSYVFTELLLAVFPLRPRAMAYAISVLHMVFKTILEQLKTAFSLGNIAGNISCEDGTEMILPFRLDTIITLYFFRNKLLSFE